MIDILKITMALVLGKPLYFLLVTVETRCLIQVAEWMFDLKREWVIDIFGQRIGVGYIFIYRFIKIELGFLIKYIFLNNVL
jgi:hypothetical protein